MAALLQTLRLFVERDLRGVIAWNDVLVSNPASDHLRAQINGKSRYALEVKSYFSVPPLGEVVLRDDAGAELVRDKNQPAGWYAVALAIKQREGVGDAPAARPIADVPPAAPVLVRPTLLADAVLTHSPLVYYIGQRGEAFANGPALVTGVWSDGALDLVSMAGGSAVTQRERVQPKGETLAAAYNCWTHYESGLRGEVDELRKVADGAHEIIAALRAQQASVRADLVKLMLGLGMEPEKAADGDTEPVAGKTAAA